MNYTVMAREEAPARPPERIKRRPAGIDELIAALEPGKIARVDLGEDERSRPMIEQIHRAGTRAGKLVDVWEVAGTLYAELATPGA